MRHPATRLFAAFLVAGLFAGPASIVSPLTAEAVAQERRPANPRHPANPRGARDPRGVADPRGIADPRGRYDPRGVYDPRGPYDPRNPYYNRYDAWQNARLDYYRYGSIRVGTYYAALPAYSTTIVVAGRPYYYSSGFFYVSSGGGYIVATPPRGIVVRTLPRTSVVVYVGPTPYYYYGGIFYAAVTAAVVKAAADEAAADKAAVDKAAQDKQAPTPSAEPDEHNYQVVSAPVGASVPYLPEDAVEKKIDGKIYFVHDNAYYRAFVSDDETIYMVVADPTGASASAEAQQPLQAAAPEKSSAQADPCVAALSPDAKKVYDAAAPKILPGDDAEEQFKSIVKNMVRNGELSRSNAKAAAQEASACMRP